MRTFLVTWVLVPFAFMSIFAGCGSGDPEPLGCVGENPSGLKVDLTLDEGPHDEPLEWWYYTGQLVSETGNVYGFELTFFQSRIPLLSGRQGHFAVTDLNRDTFRYSIDPPGFPAKGTYPPLERGFSLAVPIGWTAEGLDGKDRIQASANGYSLDLVLEARKRPLYHYGTGYRSFPFGGYTYYYTRPRMDAVGTLIVDGVPTRVTGEAWFDHQWGRLVPLVLQGWDWFSLRLDTGEEIMLFLVRSISGEPVVDGSFFHKDCRAELLGGNDFELQANDFWTSPDSGRTYPSGWTLRLPRQGLRLAITPELKDQEIFDVPPVGASYWEGMVSVTGSRGEAPVKGSGFVELTMY